MRKGFFVFILLISLILTLVYLIPKFIDFNSYKDKLTQEIEKAFEIPIKIDGNINVSILPYVYVSAKDIKILTQDKASTVINIENIYIELSLKELINIDTTQITKIILSGLKIDLTSNSSIESKRNALSKVLSGKLFDKIKTIKIQNSQLTYTDHIENKNETINNINLNITKKTDEDKTYLANGVFKLRGISSNIQSKFIISDLDNYDTIMDITHKNSKTEGVDINLKISRRQDLFNIIGDLSIKSDNIEHLINKAIPSFPKIKFTDGQSKLSSKIQFTNNILQINEIQLSNGNIFGIASFAYNLNTKEKNISIKYKNFEIPKHILTLNDKRILLKQILSELKNIKLNIITGSFKFKDIDINNIEIKADITDHGKLNIEELKISSDKISGNLFGSFSLNNNDLYTDLNISANTNFKYKLNGLDPIVINLFNGSIVGANNDLSINIKSIKTNSGLLSGLINRKKLLQRYRYNINLSSESVDIDSILSKNIFDFIKTKNQIELFKDSDFSFDAKFDNLLIQKSNLKSFTLKCDITENSITLSKLDWASKDYNVNITGKLNNITSNNGTMENVIYEVKSFDFTNVNIRYLSQIYFLSNLLQKESGTIRFKLNGYASNPEISIDGKTSNMTISATVTQNKNKKNEVNLDIEHDSLKLFINQLYGEPYSLTQKLLKDNTIKIKTKIINDKENIVFDAMLINSANQNINGSISISGTGLITADIQAKKIDLTKIIKNSNDEYKQNILIYMLNNINADINLSTDSLKTYTRTYSNLKLQINKSSQNPSFSLSTDFDKSSKISINGNVHGNQYSGNINVEAVKITESFFNIDEYDIIGGTLNSTINFETFGSNKSEVISNLSGNIIVDFIDGQLIGLSGKNTIEDNIYSSPVIMTNDVIQIIEDSLSKGETDFNNITINANVMGGVIENGQVIIDINDLLIDGSLNADMKNKQFSLSGIATISNILPEPTKATYKVKGGSVQDSHKEIVLESIISKVNPTYFKMKKHEYENKREQKTVDDTQIDETQVE